MLVYVLKYSFTVYISKKKKKKTTIKHRHTHKENKNVSFFFYISTVIGHLNIFVLKDNLIKNILIKKNSSKFHWEDLVSCQCKNCTFKATHTKHVMYITARYLAFT